MAERHVLDIVVNAGGNAPDFLGRVGGKLGDIGKLAGGALIGGVAAAGAAIAGLGVAAFNTASDIDAASDQMTAALGLTGEQAGQFEDVMTGIFANNFGDNFGDIAEGVSDVERNLRRLTFRGDTDLQRITEQAFALRDVFGLEVNETTSAAVALMENFGVTSDEAMDLLTVGLQQGLNSSGDFLDTIEEYSTQFASGGASVEGFFGLLESGLAGGALGTDKAADAFKEFRVRIQDGSSATSDALKAIGLDADAISEGLATGGLTAADVFDQVTNALWRTEDANVQFQAGVALLGTQFEDLGNAALGLELMPDAFEDAAGAADSLNIKYDNLGSAVEGYKRRALLALAPVGDKMLELANDAMPMVEGAFDFFEEHAPGVIDTVVAAFETGIGGIQDFLADNNEQIEDILNMAQRFWDDHGDAILRILGDVADLGKVIFDTFLGNILDIVQLTLQVLTGDWEAAGETLGRIWDRTWEAIEAAVGLALDTVLAIFGEFVPDFKVSGKDLIDGLLGGIKEAWGRVTDWFGGLRWPSLPSLPSLNFGIPGFQAGTRFAPGGLALVGETGPELVALPRGARVHTAQQTAGLLPAPTTMYITMNIHGSEARETGRAVEERLLTLQRRRGR